MPDHSFHAGPILSRPRIVAKGAGIALAVLVLALGAPARAATPAPGDEDPPTPEQRFLDWTSLHFSPATCAARRAAVAERIAAAGGGVLLVRAADGFSHGETFQQLDDFLYFTGLELPNSVLLIDVPADGAEDGAAAEHHTILFAPDEDARFRSPARPNDFPGRPLGTDPAIGEAAGLADVRPIEALDAVVAACVADGRILWVDAGRNAPTAARSDDDDRAARPGETGAAGGARARRIDDHGVVAAPPPPDALSTADLATPTTGWVADASPAQSLLAHLRARHPDARVANAYPAIAALRMVKSPEEIAAIRAACTITCDAMRDAAGAIRDGVDERTLEGVLEASFKAGGAQRVAFDSIIKSGPNSLWPWRILAAHSDRRNRAMHAGELVIFDVGCELDGYASDVGRTFPVSGRFTDEQRALVAMVTAVADGIHAAIRPGVTFADLRRVADGLIPEEAKPHMQARLFHGHHIGLDVGDASLEDLPLAPGMIFTVEPWYYDHEHEVAVFIEDDVLVTETGVENLTASLPRAPEELERMVGER